MAQVSDLETIKEALPRLPELERIKWQWRLDFLSQARAKQLPPEGLWATWLILAGRGFGKTWTGASWIFWKAITTPGSFNAVIAPTSEDVRSVCFEGPAGILTTAPPGLILDYNRQEKKIWVYGGGLIHGFSAEEPRRFRGPQFHSAWLDELAAWQYPVEAYDMLEFGLRLGENPQALITTTPRPLPIIRQVLADEHTVPVYGTTYENRDNLSAKYFTRVAKHEGTKLGRQELYGEVLDFEDYGIFKRSWFKLWPANKPFPNFEFVIQSYDTAFTEKTANDPTACTVWGVFAVDDPYGDKKKDKFGYEDTARARRMGVVLIDSWRDWLEYPDLRPKVITEFNDSVYGPTERKADAVLIEEKGSGISLIQDLQRANIPVRPYNPGKADKLQRAHSVAHLLSHGLVYIPESEKRQGEPRTWAEDFMHEVCVFSADSIKGKGKDDYVDTLTQTLALLRDTTWLTVDPEEEDDDEPRYTETLTNPYAA